MGYFSNGTEGELYEAQVCSRCLHNPDDFDEGTCAVWMIHLLHNGEDKGPAAEMLDHLIPRIGVANDLCAMYTPAKPEYADHGANYKTYIRKRQNLPVDEPEKEGEEENE